MADSLAAQNKMTIQDREWEWNGVYQPISMEAWQLDVIVLLVPTKKEKLAISYQRPFKISLAKKYL